MPRKKNIVSTSWSLLHFMRGGIDVKSTAIVFKNYLLGMGAWLFKVIKYCIVRFNKLINYIFSFEFL
ncbi:MAG: hypothetical protein RR942_05630 [Romboutsia sp.]